MRKAKQYIMVVAVGLALGVSAAIAQRSLSPATQPEPGSIASQLMLKRRLQKSLNGTLAVSLKNNQTYWANLTDQQRQEHRLELAAFLATSLDRQQALLQRYDTIAKLPAGRQLAYRKHAAWLKDVVESFSPSERQALGRLPAMQRAAKLLKRRDQLAGGAN